MTTWSTNPILAGFAKAEAPSNCRVAVNFPPGQAHPLYGARVRRVFALSLALMIALTRGLMTLVISGVLMRFGIWLHRTEPNA